MPFKSQQQRKFFYATMPKKASEWEKETPKGKLPKKVECGGDPVAMERLPGGAGSEHDPGDFDQTQLMKGIHHEMEHSGDIVTAMEIAMDHLSEDPVYYDHMKESSANPFDQKPIGKIVGATGSIGDTSMMGSQKPQMAPPTIGKDLSQAPYGTSRWAKERGPQKPQYKGNFFGQTVTLGKQRVDKKVAWKDKESGKWRGGKTTGWDDGNQWVWDDNDWILASVFDMKYPHRRKESKRSFPALTEVYGISEDEEDIDEVWVSQRQAHKIDNEKELDPLGVGLSQPKRPLKFGGGGSRI